MLIHSIAKQPADIAMLLQLTNLCVHMLSAGPFACKLSVQPHGIYRPDNVVFIVMARLADQQAGAKQQEVDASYCVLEDGAIVMARTADAAKKFRLAEQWLHRTEDTRVAKCECSQFLTNHAHTLQ